MKPVIRTPVASLILLVMAALAGPVAAEQPAITQGSMRYTVPDSDEVRELPLEHTDVQIAVSGTIAEVTVTQTFSNPLDHRLEAVYVFPLPDRAAIDDMSMKVGERLIRGEIHRREQARQIYEQARAQGRLTGLLDQERPNIFTQRVANILPGEAIEVVIHYVEDLHFDHGTWKLVFPTVVGPRYIPGSATGRTGSGWSPDTDRVPDASRITPPVLKPGERSGHDIGITVNLAPGFAIRELGSSSHAVEIDRRGRRRASVRLAALDTIPNKDFVLSWSTAAAAVESTLITHRVDHEGYLTLILQPPAQPEDHQVVPREVVFVIDSSGSMSGEPMAACKQLVRKALRQLRPDDSFRLIRFAGSASQLHPEPLPADKASVERALSWLDNMRGGGGTEMLEGVRAALEAPTDPYRLRMVLFLTDGFIGNEHEILRRVKEKLGNARIFSLGVGSSVNRFLLDRLAEAGRGTAEYHKPGESPDQLVTRFYERITDPVFTQLELDWGGLEVADVEPAQLPDLFAAQPLLIHARYTAPGRGTVTLRGWAGTERIEVSTRVRLPRREARNAAQAQLWARARIARLEMSKLGSDGAAEITEEITELALQHRLMTSYTSFVAVDRSEIRDHGRLVTVDQPVPMPEGVSYEGVFGVSEADSNLVLGVPSAPPPQPVRYRTGGGSKVKREGIVAQERLRDTRSNLAYVPDPTPDDPEPVRDASPAEITRPSEQITGQVAVPAGPEKSSKPLLSGSDVPVPQRIHTIEPEFTRAALQAKIRGVVILRLTIDEQGKVIEVESLRGLPLGLTESAVAAAKQWLYAPTIVDGNAVRVQHVQVVRFKEGIAPLEPVKAPPPQIAAPSPSEPLADPQPVTQPIESAPAPLPAITSPNEGRPATPGLGMHVSVQRSKHGMHLTEIARLALALSILLLLLSSGAWLLRRALV